MGHNEKHVSRILKYPVNFGIPGGRNLVLVIYLIVHPCGAVYKKGSF